ncbi:MAG: hypothetical protein AB1611_12720 [bacterium]
MDNAESDRACTSTADDREDIRTDWLCGGLPALKNLHTLPVLHGSMEMARVALQAIRKVQPDVVLLEFPANLELLMKKAVARLPNISVVVFPPRKGEKGGAKRAVYFLIEPVDPICAAAWFCHKNNIPFHGIDRDPDPDYPPVIDLLPDPAALESLGYSRYVQLSLGILMHGISPASLNIRLKREKKDLQRDISMAWRIQQEIGRGRRVLLVCGLAHLAGIRRQLGRQIFAQPLPDRKNPQSYLARLHPDCLPEVMSEIPAIEGLWAQAIQSGEEGSATRQDYQARLLDMAARTYRETWHETLTPQQIQVFNRYAYSYAREQGRLILDHYGLLVAARNCLGETFSYVLYQKSSLYPFYRPDGLPELFLRAEDLQLGSTRVRFRPRPPKKEKQARDFVKRKGRDLQPEKWKNQALLGECSHCPEDQKLNAFTDLLCNKATGLLNKNITRIEPFTTTLGEGIDIRETIQHWKIRGGQQIYIRRQAPCKAAVTSVVVIFHESYRDRDFPYLRTWTRERWEEVERAFYATSPLDHPIGPQIFRCEYGGFLASYNRPGLSDIWIDPDFSFASCHAERLLLAGAAYSNEKTVLYIAPSPPRRSIVRICEFLGKRVIYLDLSLYPRQYLDRLRFFHVLGNHRVRDYAEDFIHPLR